MFTITRVNYSHLQMKWSKHLRHENFLINTIFFMSRGLTLFELEQVILFWILSRVQALLVVVQWLDRLGRSAQICTRLP